MAPGLVSGREGTIIPIETADKERLQYWQRQAKSVPAELLRELGWLTKDRRVTVQDSRGVAEQTGDEVHTDVLFLRPRDLRTEQMWDFVLQLGHRRILSRRLAEDNAARARRRADVAQELLDAARKALATEEHRARPTLNGLRAGAVRLINEGRAAGLAARAARTSGRTEDVATAAHRLGTRLRSLRTIRDEIAAAGGPGGDARIRVSECERSVAAARSAQHDWESWTQPAVLPGLFALVDAFLTREQMHVGQRATEELSRNDRPAIRWGVEVGRRLDADEPVLGR